MEVTQKKLTQFQWLVRHGGAMQRHDWQVFSSPLK